MALFDSGKRENRLKRRLRFVMTDVRIHLSDREILRVPLPGKGWYLARDTELKGFFVIVEKRKRTFTVQGDLRIDGKRQSIRVNIGDAAEIDTRDVRGIAKGYLSQIGRGEHPRPETARRRKPAPPLRSEPHAITLAEALVRYRDGHMIRKGRSPATIAGYTDHVERIFADWGQKSLKEIAGDPAAVAARHNVISAEHGPYIANGSMRTLRAIYNHALKTNLDLPARNPSLLSIGTRRSGATQPWARPIFYLGSISLPRSTIRSAVSSICSRFCRDAGQAR